MGTTLSSIHIYSDSLPPDFEFAFRSFSPGWQTYMADISEQLPANRLKTAKTISRKINAPVLFFSVFDSDELLISFFLNGKEVSCYSDISSSKKLYDIPALVGYKEGQKRRLSTILACADTELKIELLEEYFGVCLLFSPEMIDEPDTLRCEKGDAVYQTFLEEEKKLTGKAAPFALKKIKEYPGKLFYDFYGGFSTLKLHYFLWGFSCSHTVFHSLHPVRFSGPSLEPSDLATFREGRISKRIDRDERFEIHYGSDTVTFADACPPAYRGATMILPKGFYPDGFTATGKLLLSGNRRVFIADESLKIIAKLPIKGEVADVIDNYILTTVGNSFFAYDHEPNAKIFIYEIIEKTDK